MAEDSKYLTGVKELTGKLTEISAQFAVTQLRGVTREAIGEAEHIARATIPVGNRTHVTYKGRLVSPGFSQASIRVVTAVDKARGTVSAILGVAREAFYATIFVELGTSKMPAKPWLRPAFEQSKDPMLKVLADTLRERVERIARKRGKK